MSTEFTMGKDLPTEILPFSARKQEATLGHLLLDPHFFKACSSRLLPTYFGDLNHNKIWTACLAFEAKHGRVPAATEIAEAPSVMVEDAQTKNRLKAVVTEALNSATLIGKDVIQAELAEWLQACEYQKMVLGSYRLYKSQKLQEAITLVKEKSKEIAEIRFAHDLEMSPDDYGRVFDKRQAELQDAVSFGIGAMDHLLNPAAKNGSLLKKDMTVLLGSVNSGKCLGKDTPVIMADGSIKMVQDITTGESLMGPDGKPRRVLSTTSGIDSMYRIIPKSGGESWTCNAPHVLSLKRIGYAGGKDRKRHGEIIQISCEEYIKKSKSFKYRYRLYRAALDFEEKVLEVPPYILGIWLGDGHTKESAVTSMDPEIVSVWTQWVISNGDGVTISQRPNNQASTYRSHAAVRGGRIRGAGVLRDTLGVLGRAKRIPFKYLTASRRQRLELLAGIVDSDGYYGGYGFDIVTSLPELAGDYAYLARSLGFKVTVTQVTKRCQTGAEGIYNQVHVRGNLKEVPVLLSRKRAKNNSKRPDITGFRVESIGKGEYFGFELDGDHLFLLGDFTVTHNTRCMATIVRHNALRGKNVLYLMHEGNCDDVYSLLYASLISRPEKGIWVTPQMVQERLYATAEGRRLIEQARDVWRSHVCFVPIIKAGMTVEDVVTTVRRKNDEWAASHGGRGFDLVVDDYPALLSTVLASKGNLQYRHTMHAIYLQFSQLAGELDVHSLVGYQSNREGAKAMKGRSQHSKKRLLTRDDMEESSGPGQTAANIITINRDDELAQKGAVVYYLDKSRSNQTGYAVMCKSRYDACITHDDALGATWYMGTGSHSTIVENLLEQYPGQQIPPTVILQAVQAQE